MYTIANNAISLTRGDSFNCSVGIKIDGQAYDPVEGDVVKFYLKRAIMTAQKTAYVDAKPLIEKIIPNDTMLLHLEPSDTKGLAFGDYVYDCEITFVGGDTDTFINNETFKLLPEVG